MIKFTDLKKARLVKLVDDKHPGKTTYQLVLVMTSIMTVDDLDMQSDSSTRKVAADLIRTLWSKLGEFDDEDFESRKKLLVEIKQQLLTLPVKGAELAPLLNRLQDAILLTRPSPDDQADIMLLVISYIRKIK